MKKFASVWLALILTMAAAGCSKHSSQSPRAMKQAQQKIEAAAADARDEVRDTWKRATGPKADGTLADSKPSEKPSAATIHHGRRRK